MSNFDIKKVKSCYEIAESVSKWITLYLSSQINNFRNEETSAFQHISTKLLSTAMVDNLIKSDPKFVKLVGSQCAYPRIKLWATLEDVKCFECYVHPTSRSFLAALFNKYNFCQLPVTFCNCLLPILSDITLPVSPSGSGDGTCHIWRANVSSPEQVRRFLLLLLVQLTKEINCTAKNTVFFVYFLVQF